jgi:mono/diheme cytochrome c family protein
MVTRILAAFAAMAIAAGAAQAQTIKKVPVKPTSATDGKQMFDSYCAVCHGKDGKGGGPAAKALTKVPADLTQLSAKNGGEFPDIHVRRFIEGVDEVPAHGSRDMPMWGEVFSAHNNANTAPLRVEALATFLKSMQK